MPFAATGGLGDVMGSLPAAIKAADESTDIRVVMPLYRAIDESWREQMTEVATFHVWLSWRKLYCGVKSLCREGVTYYFIDNEYYFDREGLYGHYDDGERYAYFCMAVLEMLSHIDFFPDVLHAHDWQGALSIVYLDRFFRGRTGYEKIRTVYTIHNIEYQGHYDFSILYDVFGLGEEMHDILAYDGRINLMKGAIVCANLVSTVSPRYAEEIRSGEFAHRLEYIINDNAHKLRGILNGIDYVFYDPAHDGAIAHRFSAETAEEKVKNKTALQRELGLPEGEKIPMLAMISRLATHKGLDLVWQVADGLLATENFQLVVLGTGEERYERFFEELAHRFPDRVRALLRYDRTLSKRIYAAADLFVMPSRSEPCGLAQMIASRYGAIPVVRETGGLFDSIKGYYEEDGEPRGNGFTFAGYRADELYERILAALALYRQKEKWQALVTRVMRSDFSWSVSAQKYLAMYQEL